MKNLDELYNKTLSYVVPHGHPAKQPCNCPGLVPR